ncbi:MAG: tRNA 2-thiouridine(34) synthase MnmA [Candidatus Omnitrophica bacterium]|nr:tRNA 2-thiouridine(34) synthase MnmA [Candidatus Omnitrophota bacterium]MCF7893652.1 tRNA 2-thiouridine(34) synthase MnmA [Candidatus Omnitrophota bacterium]
MKKVMVAMSGGVDSSVAALLLKEAGFFVAGVTMSFANKSLDSESRKIEQKNIEDAKQIAKQLKIKHYIIDFSKDLENKVIENFLKGYLEGKTPNPCVHCNKVIKFGALLKKAKKLGFNFLATGHYAKIEKNKDRFLLKKPKDKTKDQTYFIYSIKKENLADILFPLADYKKEQIQDIAKERQLSVFDKPQSQDLCFILQKKYTDFIKVKKGREKCGLIVNTDGEALGKHKGISFYTIGQRKGLGISAKEPLYVLAIDAKNNKIVVGKKKRLKKKGLIAGNLNLFVDVFPKKTKAKIRYAHKEAVCSLENYGKKLKAIFLHKQEAITPGQAVVFYNKDIVLGGGIIEEALDEYN